MALIKQVEKSDGSKVTYWKVNDSKLRSNFITKDEKLEFRAHVSFDGYVDKAARQASKDVSHNISVKLTKEELCKVLNTDDIKAGLYEVCKVKDTFAGSQDDL